METDGFLVHGDAVQNCLWREAERELFAQRNSHSNRRARCLPYRQFDRACADFLCRTSPLFDKINGFCYLSVYHQNIKITCRGGVSPPENERFILARSVYYLTNELAPIAFPSGEGVALATDEESVFRTLFAQTCRDRRPRRSETDGFLVPVTNDFALHH